MKTMHRLSWILGLLLLGAACSRDQNPFQSPANSLDMDALSFPHSMKGWELYSWPAGDTWMYSILQGTNRLKTYEEVTKNTVKVTGEDSLKMVLDKLPENENILWIGQGWLENCWGEGYHDLSLPPQEILDQITEYCTNHHLVLQITN
jgi:hypothetical protein